ncbi:uncharacterized protein LOC124126051 [Haliotis rufescens]|uniref:uncharacterized protein LOC124126051 n=1 Tax=Haliotis rufescens TaxID=6454 RepID=UPI00201EF794|nr:uncharacterized protein LOC124126051 [Haliotis rufescens]
MVPCINKQECQPPMPIDVDMDEPAEREVLQFARENLLDSEDDWQPEERRGMPPPSTNRKTSRGKKRLDMDNEMEVDADTRHTTPLVHNSSQKRKKKGATAARVRRRLEVDQVRVQTDMLLVSEDEGQMVQTTSRRQIVRPRSTPRQAVGAPDGPPMVTSHHQAVKDFAATLSMTQLQTIVTELLFRDQGSFEDYLHGYRPCDNPPSQPQPEDLPRWCRCGNCRPMLTYLLTYFGDLTCAFRLMRISYTGPARPFNVFPKGAKVVCATQEGALGVAYIEFGNFEIWNRPMP